MLFHHKDEIKSGRGGKDLLKPELKAAGTVSRKLQGSSVSEQ